MFKLFLQLSTWIYSLYLFRIIHKYVKIGSPIISYKITYIQMFIQCKRRDKEILRTYHLGASKQIGVFWI